MMTARLRQQQHDDVDMLSTGFSHVLIIFEIIFGREARVSVCRSMWMCVCVGSVLWMLFLTNSICQFED